MSILIPAVVLAPFAAALLIALAPERLAKVLALGSSVVAAVLTLAIVARFDWGAGAAVQGAGSIPFLPDLGVNLSYGIDAISLWLIILTAFLQPLMVVGSFTAIDRDVRTYYAWLTGLQGALFGVFAAQDLVFFYICFEFTLLPLYVLINLFGSTNRQAAATKFFLYTFTGSIVALAGLVYVAYFASQSLGGEWSFDLGTLAFYARQMSGTEQALVMLAMLAGFAVKVPLFPVHTWLPLAHTEAPTAGSVILAGVLLKLGTYAIFRFVLGFVPDAVIEYAGVIAVLSVIGILYGGLICWVQRDVKKLVAYSSVAHLGFCVLGMFALNATGLQGSVLYMINHGLSTGALFFCIGMMYERYHTRSMEEVGGLASKMPVWSFFMVFFTLASVGLPGLNGFVSEFLCLMGAFQSGALSIGEFGTPGTLGPWFAAVAGTGMIVAAIYLLYMVGKVVFGPLREPGGHDTEHGHGHGHGDGHGDGHGGGLPADLSRREIGVLVPLAIACVVLGVYPKLVTDTIEAPILETTALYESALGGGVGMDGGMDGGVQDIGEPVVRDFAMHLLPAAHEEGFGLMELDFDAGGMRASGVEGAR
ncbi:MAG: complex I subunit 4 family protein [Phycisphaerales bacterium]